MDDIRIRPYVDASDYALVDRFLVDVYRPEPNLINWLQPRWEYMHAHPYIEGVPLERMGVVERDGAIVGLVHLEHSPAFVYFQLRPGCDRAKEAMVDWAEAHLGGRSQTLQRDILGLYINDLDTTLQAIAVARGFHRWTDHAEEHAWYRLHDAIPSRPLPPGYHLQSLEEENDLHKINRVLWRGFNHEGPPPKEEVPRRGESQQTPGFRMDLTIVAVAPDGNYASYAGMWVVPENRVAYVEPVATDPEYRRMGLGAACVSETLQRAAAAGADIAWVGSGLELYKSIGFEVVNTAHLWVRDL